MSGGYPQGKLLILGALVVFACGCRTVSVASYIPPVDAKITRTRHTQSGQLLGLRENQLLAVHLTRCMDGRHWGLVERGDASVLRFKGVHHTGDPRQPCTKQSETIFYFEAVGPGITSFTIQVLPGTPRKDNESFGLTVDVTY